MKRMPGASRSLVRTPLRDRGLRVGDLEGLAIQFSFRGACLLWGVGFTGFGLQVSGVGFQFSVFGCRVQGAGCRVQGAGCRVQGAGCRVQGSGFRVLRTCFWSLRRSSSIFATRALSSVTRICFSVWG